MFRVRMLEAAIRGLERLDKRIGRRIVGKINWLAQNLDRIRPEPLAGNLAGLCKLRVGDYRVVYEPLRAEEIIVIHVIEHRRDVYRRR